MEAMDAFDGIIIMMIWSPWYIGVLISCIVRNIISKNNQKKETENACKKNNPVP